MKILLVVEEGRARRWMGRLAARIASLRTDIRIVSVEPSAPPIAGLSGLIELERLLKRRLRHGGTDPVATREVAPPAPESFTPDTVIDLTGAPLPRPGARVLVPTFDGAAGEAAMVEALMAGGSPLIELVDLGTGIVLERGLPSLETASGLTDAIACVAARVHTLVVARIAAEVAGYARPAPPAMEPARGAVRRSPTMRGARLVAGAVARMIYRLCCHTGHWRVGWRMIDGPGIAETGRIEGPAFKVVADPGHRFYADPFAFTHEGRSFVFVEDLDHRVGRGIISALPFDENGPCGPAIPVLDEPWHLSYPQVFAHDGAVWMIPESCNAHDVALYRCVRFPDRWERVATLIAGPSLSDATVFEVGGRWWMFSSLHDGDGGWSDVLAIHSAPALLGPWTAHAANPILVDRRSARPAGAVFRRDGRLFRPVQDCSDGYGGALGLAEITRLDDEGYAQVVRDHIAPGPTWPGRKLHTLNRCGRLEVIDGSVIRPKSRLLTNLVEARTVPKAATR